MAAKQTRQRLEALLEARTARLVREIRKRRKFQTLVRTALKRLSVQAFPDIAGTPSVVLTRFVHLVFCTRCGATKKSVPTKSYAQLVECARADGWTTVNTLQFYCPGLCCQKAYRVNARDAARANKLPPK